jgi:4'-phosphopantetheinyl transferase
LKVHSLSDNTYYWLMIICCYNEISHNWSAQELADKLVFLPEKLKQQALSKRQLLDKQLSIAGKLLLVQLLKNLRLDKELSLENLKYNAFHRPYFDANVDFNISHSGKMAICCGTITGKIGIDIEYIKETNLDDYTGYFTENEWTHINKCQNRYDGFYHYWTKKEAVLKAIGTGFHTPLSSVDVSGESLIYDDITYHMQTLDIGEGYKCHIATTVNAVNVGLLRINV